MLAERGIDADALAVSENEFGKPRFTSRSDVHFNVSHSGDRVMAAVSHAEVGCDVERIMRIDDGMLKLSLVDAERTRLASFSGEARDREFIRLWVRKEIYVKAAEFLVGNLSPAEASALKIENGQAEPYKPLVDFIATYEGEIEDVRKLSLNFEVWTSRTFEYFDMKDTAVFSEQGEGTNWVVRYRWEAYKVLPADYNYDSINVRVFGEYPYGGVQLWENGPYWMEANVGAGKPEESGYYFQWGDTIGYRRENGKWVASDGSSSDWDFRADWITMDKTIGELMEMGILEESEYRKIRLTSAYNPVQVHCGGPWRLPYSGEFGALGENADATWTDHGGVQGFEMRGRGEYAERVLFFPAAGEGDGKGLDCEGSWVGVWSTSPDGLSGDGVLYAHAFEWLRDPEWPYEKLQAEGPQTRSVAYPVRAMRSWDSGRVAWDMLEFSMDARFTKTTEVPVAYSWLNYYYDMRNADDAAHENRAKEMAENGINKVYECFLLGLDPTDSRAKLEFRMEKKATSLVFSWMPDLNEGRKKRQYTIMARDRLDMGDWEDVSVQWDGAMSTWGKFFRLKVGPVTERACATSGRECGICDHESVVLWEGGPAWSTHNIGAKEKWDYGHYFQFGDPVGNKWVDDGDGKGHWQRLDCEGGSFSFTPETCKTYDILGLKNLAETGIVTIANGLRGLHLQLQLQARTLQS